MDSITAELVRLLEYLLPGLISISVFYSITSFPRPSHFDKVIQALVYLVLIQGFTPAIEWSLLQAGKVFSFGKWNDNVELIWNILLAVFLGLSAAWITNTDIIHSALRKLGITKETSYPSEWYGTFNQELTFIVLHFKDGRRIYGWPREWPSSPDNGHFVIQNPEWLVDSGTVELTGVKKIMVNVVDVQWIELMEKTWE